MSDVAVSRNHDGRIVLRVTGRKSAIYLSAAQAQSLAVRLLVATSEDGEMAFNEVKDVIGAALDIQHLLTKGIRR